MSDTGNDIQASFPIPPPVGKLPIVDGRGYATPQFLIVVQLIWAALQGSGGVLDLAYLDLPTFGRLSGISARARQAEDLAKLSLGRSVRGGGGAVAAFPTYPFSATEAISDGAMVNTWSSSGFSARNADTTSSLWTAAKEAHGFAVAAAAMSGIVRVRFGGLVTVAATLTPGPVYLGAAGAVTSTPNSTAGQTSQEVGIALSASTMWFAPQEAHAT